MIRCVKDEVSKNEILAMWQENFAFDNGFTDFFFDELYNIDDVKNYVNIKDNIIVSSASVYHHPFKIHNRNVRVSMILGVNTKKEYQNHGYMKELMEAIIDDLSHQELLTMIQAYDNQLYERFGFRTIYYQNRYELTKDDIDSYIFKDIREAVEIEDLLVAYGRFASHFQGYKLRFKKDFELIIKKIKYENSKLIAYYHNNQIEAYCIYHKYDEYIEIKEIIYKDLKSFVCLLSYLFVYSDRVIVTLSSDENIEKYLKVKSKETLLYTMVRINDINLINQLFNCDIKRVEEVFELSDKPLFMKEGY